MTTYQKAAEIIEETLKKHGDEEEWILARRILDTLREKRIVPHQLKASEEMFTRFHAHIRYLGDTVGPNYRHWYNKAVRYAMKVQEWPTRVVPMVVEEEEGSFEIQDRLVADSSTKANNRQLSTAYQVIADEAKIRGIELPGDEHEQVRTTARRN